MADDVRVSNMPDSGSRENVAFKLWERLQYTLPEQGDWKASVNLSLDLYASCLNATHYARKTKVE